MSYLRPTCSDAAARVTNLGLSRYVPSIRQGDAPIESIANIAPHLSDEIFEATERRPSQRPLDRRWDESRGLVFGDRSHALKNRTWTSARGIIFASNIGQRRGYASRPIGKAGPRIWDPQGLPSMERPAPAPAPDAQKGKKQEQMEKDLKDRDQKVKDQADVIQKLKAQLITENKALEDNKERIYSKGIADGLVQAKIEFEHEKKTFEGKHREMQVKLQKAEARYPELKRDLEADIVRREVKLTQQNELLDAAREKQEKVIAEAKQFIEAEYREANQFAADVKRKAKQEKDEIDERDREVTVKELGIRTRKAQRSNYSSYRNIWRNVQNERILLDIKLRAIKIQLVREGHRLNEIRQDQDSGTNSAVSDQSQLTPEKVKELEIGVDALRKDLNDVDKELQIIGHESRNETRGTRFDDTRLAANSMGAALYTASINPLRSIRTRTQQDIDDTEDQILNASNATTREELKYQKDALSAEKVTVSNVLDLAFLDRNIQTFETLRNEPYVHKAVHLATFDLQLQVDRLFAQSFERDRKYAKSPEYWRTLRDTLKAANVTAKKSAQLLEMRGEHKEHEKRLDAMIAEKIADLNYSLQAKRAQLFNHHKSARAAAKRATIRTARAWGATSSSSTTADAFAPSAQTTTTTRDERNTHRANRIELKELRSLLKEATVSLDPESRAAKVHRFTTLHLEICDYDIKSLANKLISSPRKRSESEYNQEIMKKLHVLQGRRRTRQYNFQNGIGPNPTLNSTASQQTPDGIKNTAVVAESSGSLPTAAQDDGTKGSEQYDQKAAEVQLRISKDELREAEEAGESKRIEAARERLAALKISYDHAILQNAIRSKAALGEVTPENALKHKGLDMHIAMLNKAPQTRRVRLKHGQNQKGVRLGSPEGKRQRELQREVRRLKALNVVTSDHGEGEKLLLARYEIAQINHDLTARSLQDLGPKTAENAMRHEQLSRGVAKYQDNVSRLSALKTKHTDAAGHDNSDSGSLDNLMAAWSSDENALNDVPTASTTEPTAASEVTVLNMKPTSVKQATYQPTGSKDFHDQMLWADFLRQQELRESRKLSSSATDSVNENVSGPGDVSVVPSAECATADAISNISTEAARDNDDAKNDLQASASLSPETPSRTTSSNDTTNTANTMTETDEDFVPTDEVSPTRTEIDENFVPTYEISSNDKKNALIASRNSTASFWRYSLYKNAAGDQPTRHYCTTFEQTEAQVAKFLGEKVVGFDLEWEKYKSKPSEDSAKRCVSLMQIAAEDKVALFHLAMFKGGDSTEELIPQSLRAFLEDPTIIKVGVNIGGDATRLRNCFGIEMQGNIELSHLYKLVRYGESHPAKVNRALYALASQVQEVLHLPLAKGAVRTSSWSKRLNGQQTEYAVSDAYAGLRLYYELERRRKAMKSKPPRPAFHELGLPISLGGDEVPSTKARRGKQPVEVPGKLVEDVAALQEQDDGDASDDSENMYDDPEELEAFNAYVESQDADAMTSASLPEITYPILPPLDDLLSEDSDVDDGSSLPSDPITRPSASRRTPTLHTSEAATADSWATAWRAQPLANATSHLTQPYLRAYHLWHYQGFDLKEIPALLRKEPLALSTVVSYIAEVLQKEDVEFDVERVRELRARLPSSVRWRYPKLYANDGKDEV
jgi:hypothetical protein